MIQLRFNPQMHDLTEFNLYHHWYAPEKKSFRRNFSLRTALWVLAPILFYCLFLLNPADDSISFPLIVGFSASAILMLYAYATYKSKLYSTAVKFYSDPLNKSFLEETYIEIDGDKLIAKQTSSITEIPLKAILKTVENKGSYYLYVNSMQAIIIPKRAFESNEKIQEFKQAINLKSS